MVVVSCQVDQPWCTPYTLPQAPSASAPPPWLLPLNVINKTKVCQVTPTGLRALARPSSSSSAIKIRAAAYSAVVRIKPTEPVVVQNEGVSSKKHGGPINNKRHSPSQQAVSLVANSNDNSTALSDDAAAAAGDPFLLNGRQCNGCAQWQCNGCAQWQCNGCVMAVLGRQCTGCAQWQCNGCVMAVLGRQCNDCAQWQCNGCSLAMLAGSTVKMLSVQQVCSGGAMAVQRRRRTETAKNFNNRRQTTSRS